MSLLKFGFTSKRVSSSHVHEKPEPKRQKQVNDFVKPLKKFSKPLSIPLEKTQKPKLVKPKKEFPKSGQKPSEALSYGEHYHHKLIWATKTPLKVPLNFITQGKLTPNMKTWWEFKQQYTDCLLLFKVGKFYEIYHMDADVAVQNTNLTYMKGDVAHCGFPEIAFGKFCNELVNEGYRVARVEQTETPGMMKERTGKKSGCVARALCGIVSPGTRTFDFRTRQEEKPDRTRILSIYQEQPQLFNFVSLECSTGECHTASIQDSVNLDQLRTILVKENPAEILLLQGNLSESAEKVVRHIAPGVCFKILTDMECRDTKDMDVPFSNNVVTMSMKLLTSLLQQHLILEEVAHILNVKELKTADSKMTIDAVSLENLHLVPIDGSNPTLFSFLNRCSTKFGSRLLRSWIESPLMFVPDINQRNHSVQILVSYFQKRETREYLQTFRSDIKIKDLEYILKRIDSLGYRRDESHPDTQAVFYENVKLNKSKIQFLINGLRSLKQSTSAVEKLLDTLDIPQSLFLDKLNEFDHKSVLEELSLFENTFDLREAEETGSVEPHAGIVPSFDAAMDKLNEVKQLLDKELVTAKKHFSEVKFTNSYQLEVKEKHLPRSIPQLYELVSKTKTVRRFQSTKIKQLVDKLSDMKQELEKEKRFVLVSVFQRFSSKNALWEKAMRSIATLDCLLSLADVCASDGNWCQPEFVEHRKLSIKGAWHPIVAQQLNGQGIEFIPNNLDLSGEESVMLLTGPNMAGKSTTLREMCICVILAQIGCLVPAETCEMSIFDRVFTRLGASDRIIKGQSTFFVELFETANILNKATEHSLVIFDEIGRGTNTHDGSAIADAVIREIIKRSCIAVFATHFHQLVEDLKSEPVQLRCMGIKDMTFLYTLEEGVCTDSYGLHVAGMAGLDESILESARKKQKQLKAGMELNTVEALWRAGKMTESELVAALDSISQNL